jgi:5-bromo-4-chloroindolyl phosphate hydrolysis protein
LGDELRLAVSITALPAQLGGVARSDRSASEAAKAKRLPFHYLELTDNEYMVVRAAIERWRNDMRKAVKKGKAVPADLVSEDSLWRKLQEVMALRMREAAL